MRKCRRKRARAKEFGDPQLCKIETLEPRVLMSGTPTVAFALASSSWAESATPTSLVVSLSEASGSEVTVDYSVTGGDATGSGTDYTLSSGTLTFAAGETTKTVDIVVVDDASAESDETIEVTLANAANATLGVTTVHTYTIEDNDSGVGGSSTLATFDASNDPSVSGSNMTHNAAGYWEGTGMGGKWNGVEWTYAYGDMGSMTDITFDLKGNFSTDGTDARGIGVYIYNGSMTAWNSFNYDLGDYADFTTATKSLASGDWSFGGGASTMADILADVTKIMVYGLPTSAFAVDNAGFSSAGDNIVDFDATTSSGSETVTTVQIAVSLDQAATAQTTVDYGVTGGTASGSGVDYTLASGTVTFEIGEQTKNITITVINDGYFESDETIIVSLRNASGAVLGANSTHTYTIQSEDSKPTVEFDAITSSGAETTTTVNLVVTLSAAAEEDVTVDYAVTGGTATGSGTDYTLANGTVTFSAGETTKNITITVVNDASQEADETIAVTLSNTSANAVLGDDTVHTYTILDNDTPPTVEFDATSSADSETQTTVNIAVSLSNTSDSTVTVDYAVTGGTATGSGTDYTLASGTLTFNSGETTKNITITVVNDPNEEANETIELTLSNPSNATLGATTVHTYTIQDNDAPPDVEFDAASSSGSEATTPATIAVSLASASESTITVDYAVTGGTATGSGTDYTLASGTLTFNAGETTKNISLALVDDLYAESGETVIITLSNPSNANLGATTAHTFTITDNDGVVTLDFESAGDEDDFVALNGTTPTISSVAGNGGSVLDIAKTNAAGAVNYSPDGDFSFQNGTISTDVHMRYHYDDGGGSNTGSYQTLILKDFTDSGSNYGAYSVKLQAIDGDIRLWVGAESTVGGDMYGFYGTGDNHSDNYYDAQLTTYTAIQTDGNHSLGWWNIEATITNINGEDVRIEVTITDADSNTYTVTWNDTESAADTDAGTPGAGVYGIWSITGQFDNYTITPAAEPSTPAIAFDAVSANGSEATGTVQIAVSLDAAAVNDATVDYAVTGGTATGSGTDYTLASGTLTFLAGQTTQYITLSVTDDAYFEVGETVEITLSNPGSATLGGSTVHTYTINNDDSKPTVEFAATSSSGAETTTTVNLTVTLSAAAESNVTVDYAATGGTATGSGTDYTLANGTLTFAAGETSKTIAITVVNDPAEESDETIVVTLSNASANSTLGGNTAHTYTIQANDVPPTVEFDAASSSGAESDTSVNLAVSLSGASESTITIDYAVTGGTAAGSGTDYTLASGTLTFNAGETTKNIALSVINDALVEYGETVIVTLSNPSNATLGATTAHTYTITDDDRVILTFDTDSDPAIASAGMSHNAGGYWQSVGFAEFGDAIYITQNFGDMGDMTQFTIDVKGAFTSEGNISNGHYGIGVTLGDGSGGAVFSRGRDTPDSDGWTTFTIDLDDLSAEGWANWSSGGESWNDVLSNVQTITIYGLPQTAFAIDNIGFHGTDANAAPTVDAGADAEITMPTTTYALDGTVGDDGLPSTPGSVTTTWSKLSGAGTVSFSDASAVDTTATFSAAGTYVLLLQTNDGRMQSSDTITITVNGTPEVAFDLTTSDGVESVASPPLLTVSLSATPTETVTVDYAVTGGTATGGGTDFTLASGTVTFNAGETSKTITLSIVDDAAEEGSETIIITLSNPSNATLGANTTHTYTILNNDGAAVLADFDHIGDEDDFVDLVGGPTISRDTSGDSGALELSKTNSYTTAKYAPGGVDYAFAAGTVTVDMHMRYQDGSGSPMALVMKDWTDSLSQYGGYIVMLQAVGGEVQLWIGASAVGSAGAANYEFYRGGATGHTDFYTSVIATYTAVEDGEVQDLGWWNIDATMSIVNGASVKIDVTITDADGNTDVASWTDSGSAAYTGEGNIGLATYTVESISGQFDNFAITPDGTVTDPTVAFDLQSSGNAESVTSANLLVRLSAPSTKAITVNYAVTGGTASNSDYVLASGTLTFAAGETTKNITLSLVDDNLAEDTETLQVTLSSPSNATLGDNTVHTYSILDNDSDAALEGFESAGDESNFSDVVGSPTLTRVAGHGGSYLEAYQHNSVGSVVYSPGGTTYMMTDGTVSADFQLVYYNTIGSAQGLILKQWTDSASQDGGYTIVLQAVNGEIKLWVGASTGPGAGTNAWDFYGNGSDLTHTAVLSTVIATYDAVEDDTRNDLGWWNVQGVMTVVNGQMQIAVTVTGPDAATYTANWTDSGTAAFTGSGATGMSIAGVYYCRAGWDNFMVLSGITDSPTVSTATALLNSLLSDGQVASLPKAEIIATQMQQLTGPVIADIDSLQIGESLTADNLLVNSMDAVKPVMLDGAETMEAAGLTDSAKVTADQTLSNGALDDGGSLTAEDSLESQVEVEDEIDGEAQTQDNQHIVLVEENEDSSGAREDSRIDADQLDTNLAVAEGIDAITLASGITASHVLWTEAERETTASALDSLLGGQEFSNQLDAVAEQLDESVASTDRIEAVTVGAATGVTVVLSAGYLIWSVRSGALVSSVLATLPTWMWCDPLPILEYGDRDNKDRKSSDKTSHKNDDDLELKLLIT